MAPSPELVAQSLGRSAPDASPRDSVRVGQGKAVSDVFDRVEHHEARHDGVSIHYVTLVFGAGRPFPAWVPGLLAHLA
ncbi:MAG: hypothetical protein AB7I30_17460 [Isosphaeraceae bacterium]